MWSKRWYFRNRYYMDTFVIDKLLAEILGDRKRTKAMFRPDTEENRKNGKYVKMLVDFYESNPVLFAHKFPTIVAYVTTHIDENQQKRVGGFIKMPIDFRFETKQVVTSIDFGEPKTRKLRPTVVTEVKEIGKKRKNKNSLF